MFDLLQIKTKQQILELLDWQFESFTEALLPYMGYSRVQKTKKFGKYHSDHGIDIIAYKQDQKIIGQCKLLHTCNSYHYTPTHFIRDLGGCMLRDNVQEGVFISTIPYSNTGKKEAKSMNIKLLDLSDLCKTMRAIHHAPQAQG